MIAFLTDYAKRVRETLKICKQCHRPYVTSMAHRKDICIVCDETRPTRDRMQPDIMCVCKVCGKPFMSYRSYQVYCSRECRGKAEYDRSRKQWREKKANNNA